MQSNFKMIFLGAFLVLTVIYVIIHNKLIRRRNAVSYAAGGVDVQLKKRHDLIPNIIASVERYFKHEEKLLKGIVSMRNQAMTTNDEDMKYKTETTISQLLDTLRVSIEAYPELKSQENIIHLQKSLSEVETEISAARRAYNSRVLDLNNAVQVFPNSLVAALSNIQKSAMFEAPITERENVNVKDHFEA